MNGMQGKRIYPDEETGCIPGDRWVPASFGYVTKPGLPKFCYWWQVIAPDNSVATLDPSIHSVEEHEDGTITVMPSIVTATWHGFLRLGVFYTL